MTDNINTDEKTESQVEEEYAEGNFTPEELELITEADREPSYISGLHTKAELLGFAGNYSEFEVLYRRCPKFSGDWTHLQKILRIFDAKDDCRAELISAWNVEVTKEIADAKQNRRAIKPFLLSGADFSSQDFSGLDLQNSDLSNADLRRAKIIKVNLEFSKITDAKLDGVIIDGSNLQRSQFNNSSMIAVKILNSNLLGAKFNNIKFYKSTIINTELSGSDFSESDLSHASMSGNHFIGAKFIKTNLESANLSSSNFIGVIFDKAKMKNTNFKAANLKETSIRYVTLQNTILTNAEVTDADFTSSNLRDVVGYEFDSNNIIDARFSPNAKDKYSTLRNTYTGYWFFIILLLTVLALTPYVVKTAMWLTVAESENVINKIQTRFESTINDIQTVSPLAKEQIIRLNEFGKDLNPSKSKRYKKTNVLRTVTGWEDGAFGFTLSMFLLLYNFTRGYVTLKVMRLRETEERSRHSPNKSDYKLLFQIHKILKIMLWGTLTIFIFKILHLFLTELYIPL